MNRIFCLIFVLAFALGFSACKRETSNTAVMPPKTFIFLDTITLSGVNSLNTTIRLRWSGTTADGYVTGYKILVSYTPVADVLNAFLTVNSITKQTDSLFKFQLQSGSNFQKVYFYVQAVTNLSSVDPNPPVLIIPLKNTPPTAIFDKANLPASQDIYTVISLPLLVADIDGYETLDSIALRVNNGKWYKIPPGNTILTLVPQNPKVAGLATCNVYNQDRQKLSITIDGINLNSQTKFYLKARDVAAATSAIDSTPVYNIKAQTSDLLVLDTYPGTGLPESTYYGILGNVNNFPGKYDAIDMISNAGANQPAYYALSFYFMISLYKSIFWFSDASTSSNKSNNKKLLVETAADQIRTYLQNNGKILLTMPIAKNGIDYTSSPLVSILPISSNQDPGRVGPGAVLSTTSLSSADGYTNLVYSTPSVNLSSVDTIPGSRRLYTANISLNGSFKQGCIAVKAGQNSDLQKTNFVYFSAEMHQLNGGAVPNLSVTMAKILNIDFSW